MGAKLQRFKWTKIEVLTKLETKLNESFENLLNFCDKHKCGTRLRTLATGVENVARVKKNRGLFPWIPGLAAVPTTELGL